jgi:hypothetical protein
MAGFLRNPPRIRIHIHIRVLKSGKNAIVQQRSCIDPAVLAVQVHRNTAFKARRWLDKVSLAAMASPLAKYRD